MTTLRIGDTARYQGETANNITRGKHYRIVSLTNDGRIVVQNDGYYYKDYAPDGFVKVNQLDKHHHRSHGYTGKIVASTHLTALLACFHSILPQIQHRQATTLSGKPYDILMSKGEQDFTLLEVKTERVFDNGTSVLTLVKNITIQHIETKRVFELESMAFFDNSTPESPIFKMADIAIWVQSRAIANSRYLVTTTRELGCPDHPHRQQAIAVFNDWFNELDEAIGLNAPKASR